MIAYINKMCLSFVLRDLQLIMNIKQYIAFWYCRQIYYNLYTHDILIHIYNIVKLNLFCIFILHFFPKNTFTLSYN